MKESFIPAAEIKSEFTSFQVKCEENFNDGFQYSRRNCFVLEKLRNLPRNCHGTEFSKRVSEEINRLLPHLSTPVSHHDIDTSHPLNHEDINSAVIVKVEQNSVIIQIDSDFSDDKVEDMKNRKDGQLYEPFPREPG